MEAWRESDPKYPELFTKYWSVQLFDLVGPMACRITGPHMLLNSASRLPCWLPYYGMEDYVIVFLTEQQIEMKVESDSYISLSYTVIMHYSRDT